MSSVSVSFWLLKLAIGSKEAMEEVASSDALLQEKRSTQSKMQQKTLP
jgi:hypothetical protein